MSGSSSCETPAPHTRTLFRSLGVSVVDSQCRAGVEFEGPDETKATHSIVLVRRGIFRFRRSQRRETLLADANQVVFFNKGQPYRFSHPLAGGDDCTSLALETPLAFELVARRAPWDAERGKDPFHLDHALSSPRAARLHYELLAGLHHRLPALVLEDALLELTDEAVGAAHSEHRQRGASEAPSVATRKRWCELAEGVKLALNARVEAPPSLGELARAFGCSAFHVSRTFHSATGLSLRRYVGRLRARLAAERLASGARNLTELALDFGYADHSHFTNSFRHEWGLPPSRFRARIAFPRRAT